MKELKVAQFGCGKMSRYLIRYLIEKGAKIVAAFDINPALIRKDIGEHIGAEPYGVRISDSKDAERIGSRLAHRCHCQHEAPGRRRRPP